jgi:hypothetical protein
MTSSTRICCTALAYLLVLRGERGRAAEGATADYLHPSQLTGTIYATGSGTNKILFTFKRTAIRSNDIVFVVRDYLYPNGALAAREETAYQSGALLWAKLEERQTGAHGSSTVLGDPKNPSKEKLFFEWSPDKDSRGKKDTEDLRPRTLVGDMISYFIVAHWDELARGDAVQCRFIAQSRLETVGFKFVKESEVTWRGKSALRVRMEASSFIIAQIVDPLYFIVEKAEPHRIFEYVGRTTPKLRDGNKWKDLDARTVYDWN